MGDGSEAHLGEHSGGPPNLPFLRGATAEEVLAKLADGDPLGLERRVLGYLDRQGLVLAPFRMIQLSGAQVAHEAMRYNGDPPLDEWVRSCISKVAAMLINEQWGDERNGLPVAQCEDASYYRVFAELIDVELELARLVCCVINCLPDDPRRIFHKVSIQGRSITEVAADGHGGGDPTTVQRLLEEATREILLVLHGPSPDAEGGSTR